MFNKYLPIFLFLLVSIPLQVFGQKPDSIKISSKLNLKGFFLQDSIQIGLPILYTLSLKHPPELQIIFPDSSYSYQPFEFIKKSYFVTKTDKTGSLDSVIYELTTFEIDKIQRLVLPVFIIHEKDCTAIYAHADSVFLEELVKGDITKLALKENTDFETLAPRFNYPYLISAFVLIFILVLIVWGIFGKQIIRTYKMFQFRTRHAIFINEFSRITGRITLRKSIEDIEKAIALWKKHLEFVENKPFSTYTSKEISQLVPDKNLGDSLKNIDKAIYGREVSKEIEKSFTILKDFSILLFEKKRDVLRNSR